jgi:hypothetical protein
MEYYKKMDTGMIKKYLEKIPPIDKPITVTYFDFIKEENITMIFSIKNNGLLKTSGKKFVKKVNISELSTTPTSPTSPTSTTPTTPTSPTSTTPTTPTTSTTPTTPTTPTLVAAKTKTKKNIKLPTEIKSKLAKIIKPKLSKIIKPKLSKTAAAQSAFQDDKIVNSSDLYNGLRITAINYTPLTDGNLAKGDFSMMITNDKAKHCLFIFNDNIKDYKSVNAGGGNASIRPYKIQNKSWGIPTGISTKGKGFTDLDTTLYDENEKKGTEPTKFKSARYYIDKAIDDIKNVISKRKENSNFVNEILYSSERSKINIKINGRDTTVSNLGSKIFTINEDVKKYILEKLYNLPYDLINSSTSSVQLTGSAVGINNLGATCFANASFQLLACIKDFIDGIKNAKLKPITNNEDNKKVLEFLKEVFNYITDPNNNSTIFYPDEDKLKSLLSACKLDTSVQNSQDSTEFLTNLFDWLDVNTNINLDYLRHSSRTFITCSKKEKYTIGSADKLKILFPYGFENLNDKDFNVNINTILQIKEGINIEDDCIGYIKGNDANINATKIELYNFGKYILFHMNLLIFDFKNKKYTYPAKPYKINEIIKISYNAKEDFDGDSRVVTKEFGKVEEHHYKFLGYIGRIGKELQSAHFVFNKYKCNSDKCFLLNDINVKEMTCNEILDVGNKYDEKTAYILLFEKINTEKTPTSVPALLKVKKNFNSANTLKKSFAITNNFEKQEGLGCGRHALNNLFGIQSNGAFFKKNKGTIITDKNINTLDSTLRDGLNLSSFCNYYSEKTKILRIITCTDNENYLSELLALVLNKLGYQTLTYNEKKQNEKEKLDKNNDNIVGFIAGRNVSMSGGHYIALRRISNYKYLYVDSMDLDNKKEVSMQEIKDNESYNFLIKVRWNDGKPVDNEIKKLIMNLTASSKNNSDEIKKDLLDKILPEIQSRIKQSILDKYKKEGKELDMLDLQYLYNNLFPLENTFILATSFQTTKSEKELLDFFDDNFYNNALDITKKEIHIKQERLEEVKNLFNKYNPFEKLFNKQLTTTSVPSSVPTLPSKQQSLQLDKPEFTYIKNIIDEAYKLGESKRNFSVVFAELNPNNETITDYASRTYPIIHKDVYNFIITKFVDFMQNKYSTETYFNKDTYIDRLFEKRPLAFFSHYDNTLCRLELENNEDCKDKTSNFSIPHKEYISYEEMAVSALLGLSGPVHFINNGNINNNCILNFKPAVDGYLYGLVGARFEKENEMEWRHIIITPRQNTAANGYGKVNSGNKSSSSLHLWASLYGVKYFPSYNEVNIQHLDTSKYAKYGKCYFNIDIYKKRIKFSLLPFLFDVNERCKVLRKKARCFITGLGLGVWQYVPNDIMQKQYYYEAFFELLRDNKFENINTFATYLDLSFDISFDISKFINDIFQKINVDKSNIQQFVIADTWHIKLNDIEYIFQAGKINPVEQNPDFDLVNFISYAWDSNSYPGNEFYNGNLTDSMDPATMCSCDALYYHNIQANPNITQKNIRQYNDNNVKVAFEPKDLTSSSSEQKNQISYNNFITMNGHGSKTDRQFQIPPDSNIYVLIPHEKGLEQAYTVSPPSNPSNFETIIFNNRNIPVFQSNTQYTGWKLYSPGENINDMDISDFRKGDPAGLGSTPCSEIPTKFFNENKDLVKTCNENNEPACIVYHDTGLPNYGKFINTDNGKNVYKIKICGRTTLENVVKLLNTQKVHELDRPIILIPLICNASSKSISLVPIIDTTKNIMQLFNELLKENSNQEFPILNYNINVPRKFYNKPFEDKIKQIVNNDTFKIISNTLKKTTKQTKKKQTTKNNRKHLNIKNNNTKDVFGNEMYEEMNKLSNIEQKCINIYHNVNSSHYEKINYFLWNDSTTNTTNTNNDIKYLAQMLLKIIIEKGIFFDHEIIVYRNFSLYGASNINNIKKLNINGEKNFKGLLSTSYNKKAVLSKIQKGNKNENIGRIKIPANTPFIYISGILDEYELLFLPGILVKTGNNDDDLGLGIFEYRINIEHIQKILNIDLH